MGRCMSSTVTTVPARLFLLPHPDVPARGRDARLGEGLQLLRPPPAELTAGAAATTCLACHDFLRGRSGIHDSAYVGMEPDDRSWQLAISFIAAWRGTGAGRDPSAVAHRLAEVTADGNATTIEQAVLGLTTLGNMFLELYAECAGSSADAVLREASSINWDEPR
jgi:hypothetical protein